MYYRKVLYKSHEKKNPGTLIWVGPLFAQKKGAQKISKLKLKALLQHFTVL